jgi:hypothetical protein
VWKTLTPTVKKSGDVSDNKDVHFPEGSEATERVLLVVATLFIDILWLKEASKAKCILL